MQLSEAFSNWVIGNVGTIILIVFASLLSLFASWFTARYTWRHQNADERRKRIYAPLCDELSTAKKALKGYDYFYSLEYDQIASAHLLYLVPTTLRIQMRELYGCLATLSLMAVNLRRKYQEQVQRDINELLPAGTQPNAFNDSNVNTLAMDITHFLLQGQIATNWNRWVVKDISERYGWKESIDAYFEKLRGVLTQDKDMVELDAMRFKILPLLNIVLESMLRDLESQFSVLGLSRRKGTD